jgi:hypothetical protein
VIRLCYSSGFNELTTTRVVKEGGIETLLQVVLIVAVGACISNFVCVALWPQSAKKNLQANMVKTLDSFATLLALLTNTFLLEDESYQPSHEKISKAVADHQAAFTGLKKNLGEAQSERLCSVRTADLSGSRGDPYEDAVDSLTRLAQHLNGLRSGTSLQYDLAKAHRDGKVAIRRHSVRGNTFSNVFETELVKGKTTSEGHGSNSNEDAMLRAAAAMFGDLVSELDSPLHALSVSRGCFKSPEHMGFALSMCAFIFPLGWGLFVRGSVDVHEGNWASSQGVPRSVDCDFRGRRIRHR